MRHLLTTEKAGHARPREWKLRLHRDEWRLLAGLLMIAAAALAVLYALGHGH